MDFFSALEKINEFVWNKFGLFLLPSSGIFLTVKLGFFQIKYAPLWLRETLGSLKKSRLPSHGEGITQFQSFCTALASTVGVGNIAGVAAAVCSGGAGAVFWMWVSSFFGMMTSYAENVLGIYYRRKNENGEWSGGAMYYLRDGFGKKKHCGALGDILASMFAFFCILASFGMGNMGQINKIALNLESAFGFDRFTVGLVLMIAGGFIIFGGIKRIAAFAEKIVPFMLISFFLCSFAVILSHACAILPSFKEIFVTAFSPSSAKGGAAGITLKAVITEGVKRGVFSNEAGLGSAVTVNAESDVNEPSKQGMWGIFEVFADTMLVCTMTALVLLTSGVTGENGADLSDATLAARAFDTVFTFGNVKCGSMFIAVTVLLFAFTTVLGWSHYGEKATEFLFGTKAVPIYKVIFVLMILPGAVLPSDTVWSISDIFNGLMMVPNLIGVISLSGTVLKITDGYIGRRIKNMNAPPDISAE